MFRRLGRNAAVDEEKFEIGAAVIDAKKHTLTRARKVWPLTFYEVELLKLLFERRETPVSRDEIMEKIWGVDGRGHNRTVDNFIVKLRKMLEDDGKEPRHILTVYGHGYKLVP
jgi:DNA-binding response OmpR family regulator